jgi:hypothetical protein
MKLACAAISGKQGAWAIKRMDEEKKITQEVNSVKITPEVERLQLKSDLLVFYLGRMAYQKIERIDDSIKAAFIHFWKADQNLVKELFHEIIKNLNDLGHIMIENEKTYIPLRKN